MADLGNYKKLSEYDNMKAMLNLTRAGSKKPISTKKALREETIPQLQPQEMDDEKNKFTQAVASTVEFGNFMRYSDNIEWNGELIKEKIKWVYSLDDVNGCYITCEQLQLSDDAVQTIQKLKAYYDTWSEYWGTQISGAENPTNI